MHRGRACNSVDPPTPMCSGHRREIAAGVVNSERRRVIQDFNSPMPTATAAPIVENDSHVLALVVGVASVMTTGDPAPWAVRGNQRPTDGTETQARAKVPTAQGVAQIASYGATGGRIRP